MACFSLLVATIVNLFVVNVFGYNSDVIITEKQWKSLDMMLDGSVVLPTSDEYDSTYTLWTATYDHIYPEAIINVNSEKDASTVMKFLLKYGIDMNGNIVDFVCRNCQHSLAGWSTTNGIVIDTSNINHLYISDAGTGIVGPGVDLYTFTTFAEENDFTLPHGDCSSVCFGGFLLGGGFGLTSRTFGMGIDWIKSINIVLPTSGELVTVSGDNEYSDLFWALRGGGQGNFGIVTSFEMNIPEKKQTNPGLYVEIVWDYNEEIFDKVASVWNYYTNDNEYGTHFAMYFRLTPDSWLSLDYSVGLHGFWTGEQVDGLMVLAKVLDEINETPTSAKIDYVPFEGWIDHSSTDRTRYSSHCSSRFSFNKFEPTFFDRLSKGTIDMKSFTDYNIDDENESTYGIPSFFLFIAPAGGAISNHAKDETVFPWRDSKYFFATCVRWMNDYDNVKEFSENWLMELMDDLETNGHLSDKSFVNFPDNNIENWEEAYYGDNYEKLRQIKAKYDPNNYFSYRYSIQSIDESDEDAKERQQKQTLKEKEPGYVTKIDKWIENHPSDNNNYNVKMNSNNNSNNNNNYNYAWIMYIVIGATLAFLLSVVYKKFINKKHDLSSEYTPLTSIAQ